MESPYGMLETPLSRVEAVRAFNRFWTARIGALDAAHLGTPFSLAEARVLFEVREGGDATEVAQLRRRLDLDPGYLSRLLAELRVKKLVVTGVSASDGRCQVARLTPKGRSVANSLNDRAMAHIGELLAPLEEDEQRRMLAALGEARRLLERDKPGSSYVLRPPGPGDYGWVVERHGAVYALEYGWDDRFEGLVATIVGDYLAAQDPRTAAWIAEVGGERAGCIFCTKKDEKTAQLRLLLVDPRFRGMGVGARLVAECVRFARAREYRKLILWTNDVLTDARRLYQKAGFVLVESKKHASFGKAVTGQTWELDLAGGRPAAASGSRTRQAR
jgi:DNA-binding MarR family transcriptional regulator/RimJ/RimL family protein N-acetyltransferase